MIIFRIWCKKKWLGLPFLFYVWVTLGENSSKYFLSLESINYISKQVSKAEEENGLIIRGQFDIWMKYDYSMKNHTKSKRLQF